MTAAKQETTKGLEKLEFLTDKTARIIFQLEAEDKKIDEIRSEIRDLRRKREEFRKGNEDLKAKLARLEQDKTKVDEKVDGLLDAIKGLSLE